MKKGWRKGVRDVKASVLSGFVQEEGNLEEN